MALEFQVLSTGDFDEVTAFAQSRLEASVPDETERTFKSWSARWRKEALDHYLKFGWSFIARDTEGKTAGFFLAQPFLFFRGQTQTLWVELVEARDEATAKALVDVAVRVAREKHLQRILFADADVLKGALAPWTTVPLETTICEVKTTKG